jgi:hypothetical protein
VSAPHTPTLNPKVVADDALLALVVDQFLGGNDANQNHRRKILALEEELRAHVGDEAWRVFLKLDEADAARMSDLSIALAQWGFTEGLRYADGLRGNGR